MKSTFTYNKHLFYSALCIFLACYGKAQSQNGTNPNTTIQVNESNKQSISNSVNEANFNTQPPANLSEPSRSGNGAKYYESQSQNYRGYLDFSPKDANAWENYYKSTRFSNYSKTSSSISADEQKELDAIVKEMEKNVPGTYQFHFVTYLNGNNDVNLIHHLEKAYELNPNSTELYEEFINYYELTGNDSKKTEFVKKLNNSKEIHPDVLEYNYNLLNSLESKAILITHGEMDTYPGWILQDVKRTREDVKIVYLELLEKDEYRNKLLAETGITVSADFKSNKSGFLKEFAEKSSRPVYFASTVAPEILKPIQNNLYLTGLAFKYSSTEFENQSVLATNWENSFKKDAVLKTNAQGTIQSKLNMNYIPGLLILIEYYKSANKTDKATMAEEMALKLAREGGKEQQVKTYLKK
ncbi:MAG: hypothetical protein ACOZCO_16065 [Bacteroidota bacterium]